MHLYPHLDKLRERGLYCDTDSVIRGLLEKYPTVFFYAKT